MLLDLRAAFCFFLSFGDFVPFGRFSKSQPMNFKNAYTDETRHEHSMKLYTLVKGTYLMAKIVILIYIHNIYGMKTWHLWCFYAHFYLTEKVALYFVCKRTFQRIRQQATISFSDSYVRMILISQAHIIIICPTSEILPRASSNQVHRLWIVRMQYDRQYKSIIIYLLVNKSKALLFFRAVILLVFSSSLDQGDQ